MLNKNGKNSVANSAHVKARELQDLIDILNNTTIGTLSSDVALNTDAIAAINDSLIILNAKVNALAFLFGVVFDENGAVASENYTSHTHNYLDKTISDTADGTGVETDTTRTTQGVS